MLNAVFTTEKCIWSIGLTSVKKGIEVCWWRGRRWSHTISSEAGQSNCKQSSNKKARVSTSPRESGGGDSAKRARPVEPRIEPGVEPGIEPRVQAPGKQELRGVAAAFNGYRFVVHSLI